MGIEPPPEVPFEEADLSPMARSFYGDTRRISNALIKSELGVHLAYPNYREGLKALGVDSDTVSNVIISHMHYDHCGNTDMFPRARYHVQDKEMNFCTGRCMCHGFLRYPFDEADVVSMVRKVYAGRVRFHDGTPMTA